MMCYYLNVHFQGQRVKMGCRSVSIKLPLFCDIGLQFLESCFFVFTRNLVYCQIHRVSETSGIVPDHAASILSVPTRDLDL